MVTSSQLVSIPLRNGEMGETRLQPSLVSLVDLGNSLLRNRNLNNLKRSYRDLWANEEPALRNPSPLQWRSSSIWTPGKIIGLQVLGELWVIPGNEAERVIRTWPPKDDATVKEVSVEKSS